MFLAVSEDIVLVVSLAQVVQVSRGRRLSAKWGCGGQVIQAVRYQASVSTDQAEHLGSLSSLV